jgi:hypothetical protein
MCQNWNNEGKGVVMAFILICKAVKEKSAQAGNVSCWQVLCTLLLRLSVSLYGVIHKKH